MVKGKELLCSTNEFRKYFKSFQGFENDRNWYHRLEAVINNNISEKYQDFLAQPFVKGDSVGWYAKYSDSAMLLSGLEEENRKNYEKIKIDTVDHYKSVKKSLVRNGDKDAADYLEKAIKFVDDRFIYCINGEVVLGVWGMQLRNEVREPHGVAVVTHFDLREDLQEKPDGFEDLKKDEEIDEFGDSEVRNPSLQEVFTIKFNAGEHGVLKGNIEFIKRRNQTITEGEIPEIEPVDGFKFVGWDRDPFDDGITEDVEYTAMYEAIQPMVPWYRRLWSSVITESWFRWLIYGILFLLLLLFLFWLLRSCNRNHVASIPYPIEDKPFAREDLYSGRGGIYNPGRPYEVVPTPLEYRDVLLDRMGILPPLADNQIIRDPERPVIVGGRLNILMENEDKSIFDLARDFKKEYPGEVYKIIYYDDVVKRMQIEFPPELRQQLKEQIPVKLAPDYDLFVFDESMFVVEYIPKDPAFSNPDKTWYIDAIKAPEGWDITPGDKNLTVAIVDNGFNLRHPELKGKIVMSYNVWTHSSDVFSQDVDHGTAVAGIALAEMNNGIGLCGISSGVAFMPVQVGDEQGRITTTAVLDGVLYALYQGADVINISLSLQITGRIPVNVQRDWQDNYFKEEERLWNKIMDISSRHDATIVIAAGNLDMLAGVVPFNRPQSFIVVSAVDQNMTEYIKAGFSNYGEHSTVSAPGVGIYSPVGAEGFAMMSGTSMAAPMVTGAVALMKSVDENLTTEEIICILKSTGLPVDGEVGNLIQINKALELIESGEIPDCAGLSVTHSSGDVQVLLSWNNYNDLDLICIDPTGEMIWYKNKQVSSGGQLEIDMNEEENDSKTPIENIFWPEGGAPDGEYNIYVSYYWQHTPDVNETPYKVIVKQNGITDEFTGNIKKEDRSKFICSFSVGNRVHSQAPLSGNIDHRIESLQREQNRLRSELDRITRELNYVKNRDLK